MNMANVNDAQLPIWTFWRL